MEHQPQETTPLQPHLRAEDTTTWNATKDIKRTPLPKKQLAILFLLLFSEPIAACCIFPFISQLVDELGITHGDPKATGYYVGFIESLFFIAQALTVLQWGKASDKFGRRPILLIGLLGLSLSMISFGLSKTYTQVIISRSIAGFLNGNAGVAKTMIAEMSDDTNRAILFTFLPVAWISGCTVAPFVGGSLQHPAERFPAYFDHPLWRRYPYFLPCFVAASFPIFAFFIGLMFLKETNESVRRVPRGASYGSVSSEDRFESTPRNSSTPTLREAITKPVVIAIANYAALAIIDISLFAIFTVFLAVPLHAGGLNLPPQVIGNILASLGGVSGATQFLAFPRVHKRFGGKKTFTFSISFSFLLLACFPIIHVITLVYPGSWIKFAIIGVMMVIWSVYDMGYASVFLFITASSPSPSLLGTVNGAAQTIISLARAFGPAAATSLFALSIKHDWLRGYGVFLCLTLAPVVAICLSTLLPNDVEAKISRDESA